MSLQYKSKILQGKITFRADLDLRTMLNFGICLDISRSSRTQTQLHKNVIYIDCVNSP